MAFSQVDNDPNQGVYLEDWINQLQKVQKIYSLFITFFSLYIYIFMLLLLVKMFTVSHIFCPIVH